MPRTTPAAGAQFLRSSNVKAGPAGRSVGEVLTEVAPWYRDIVRCSVKAQPSQVSIVYNPENVVAPELEFYLQYWRAKQDGAAIPLRSGLRPSELKPHLRSMALLEALAGLHDFRFRLIGTGVAQHLLAYSTGRTLRETYATAESSYVEGVVRLHRTVCERLVPVLVRASGGTWYGQFYPAFDVLYLPFADDAGEATFILTAYAFPEQVRLSDFYKSQCGLPKPGQEAPAIMPSMQ
jgi:hypothetical protein